MIIQVLIQKEIGKEQFHLDQTLIIFPLNSTILIPILLLLILLLPHHHTASQHLLFTQQHLILTLNLILNLLSLVHLHPLHSHPTLPNPHLPILYQQHQPRMIIFRILLSSHPLFQHIPKRQLPHQEGQHQFPKRQLADPIRERQHDTAWSE